MVKKKTAIQVIGCRKNLIDRINKFVYYNNHFALMIKNVIHIYFQHKIGYDHLFFLDTNYIRSLEWSSLTNLLVKVTDPSLPTTANITFIPLLNILQFN